MRLMCLQLQYHTVAVGLDSTGGRVADEQYVVYSVSSSKLEKYLSECRCEK